MSRTSKARVRVDRLARGVVTAGGLTIIASILGILGFLFAQALPLIQGAEHEDWRSVEAGDGAPALCAVSSDEARERIAALDASGSFSVRDARGRVAQRAALLEKGVRVLEARACGVSAFAYLCSDARIRVQAWTWNERARDGADAPVARLADPQVVELSAARPTNALAWCAARDASSGSVRVAYVAGARGDTARLVLETFDVTQDLLGDARVERAREERALEEAPSMLALSRDLASLYSVTATELQWWQLDAEGAAPRRLAVDGSSVTAIALLLGDSSVLLGRADGSVTQYFATRAAGDALELTAIRDFAALPGAVRQLACSFRNKAFVSANARGDIAYYYATTGRRSFVSRAPIASPSCVALTPKNDGILVAGAGGVASAALSDPHPEATMHAFFEPVWYEGYEEPGYEWESTGGTNDFEPKLSIVPLLFGTLKATLFAMLLSFPLAVLAAIFVSQFTHPRIRALVKPVIEMMAAMPSVILGFVAALWLAPLLETGFTSFLLMLLVLPLAAIAAGKLWHALARRAGRRASSGSELPLLLLALAAGAALCIWLDDPVEDLLFGGDFPEFVYERLGLGYEQRNSVVIAIAMAFAVVPIVFSISEEALSNVPRGLVSGSLALGATRWQAVLKVVLPTASPGIFSATMVGLGRAIGETMIVLMATGNTAIMDWNPFNGFRTLAANIATEAPEAPVGGTLYRTLFLTALLLFVLTFLINTLAEVVRLRLRERYSNL